MKEGLWKEEAGYGKTPTPYFSGLHLKINFLCCVGKISVLGGG